MSFVLEAVPAEHRPALEQWIVYAGQVEVAACLAWVARHQLQYETGPESARFRLYGLSAPELLHLAHDLETSCLRILSGNK